jgi:hypothetical protein
LGHATASCEFEFACRKCKLQVDGKTLQLGHAQADAQLELNPTSASLHESNDRLAFFLLFAATVLFDSRVYVKLQSEKTKFSLQNLRKETVSLVCSTEVHIVQAQTSQCHQVHPESKHL